VSRGRGWRWLAGAVLAAGFALVLPSPAAADDDDSPSASSSADPGAPGGSSGGEGGRGGINLGPNPGSGDFLRDVRSVIGLITGRPPPVPAPSNQAGRELTAAGLTPQQRAAAVAAGFAVLAERESALAGGRVVRFRAPSGLSEAAAAARLRSLAPGARVTPNHLYRPSAAPCPAAGCAHFLQVNWPAEGRCGAGLRIGMIDTRIDAAHPALAGAAVERLAARGPGRRASSSAHGTAIAVLLVGRGSGAGRGLVPAARLVAADPFHAAADGDAADVYDLVTAFDRLAQARVSVVNLSLAGPANEILEAVGAEAARRGMLFVAAAGNEGPRAGPLYPAAYPWAVAVTAVDGKGEIWARAVRGRHIAFSAPGVGLPVAGARGGRSGTSYATPFVTAALALAHGTGGDGPATLARLAAAARDLGPSGRDATFGWGLVQPVTPC
jgi:hypothetical protein